MDRLLKRGIIERVQTAELGATTVVSVAKPNGDVRICGDIRVTVNSYVDMQRLPLPHPEELRVALSENTICLKVDLADAYLLMEFDEKTEVFNTLDSQRAFSLNSTTFRL